MYIIIPTNEGTEMNYNHTFKRPHLKEAKIFGEYMRDQLQKIMTQGTIGTVIQDQSGKIIATLPSTGINWE
jgi:isoaspartyl peptidase/L-asparaginase-like protein (Ntn-hydrolase superfamily)